MRDGERPPYLLDYATLQTVHTYSGEPIMSVDDIRDEIAPSDTDDELNTALDVIAAAVDGDADHDEAAKRALGEIAAHNTSGDDPVPDAREQLENILGAPADEKQHFAKQTFRILE